MSKKNILIAFTLLLSLQSFADANVWREMPTAEINIDGERKLHPNIFKVYNLNDAYFKNLLFSLSEGAENATLIALPTPDGKEMNFRVWQTPAMEPEMAAKFPGIKNFTAVSIDNPAVTAKLNYTYYGFNAMIYDSYNTYFIDPYTTKNTGYYICFYKRDYPRNLNNVPVCMVGEPDIEGPQNEGRMYLPKNGMPRTALKTYGSTKKIFRLALSCTGEYAKAVDGPSPVKANVVSAMTTTLTRVNGIFEREVNSTMQLISNNDQLVYLDPASDPFTTNENDYVNGVTQSKNQQNTDNVIGNLNYDIGHVFCSGNGGIADLEGLCDGGYKARAATGSPNPVGDPFDVDYVVHEMGHQYGAEHTFNSSTDVCSGNNVVNCAYEPGGGSTIMGYAGLCGIDDIQNNSNDYFHAKSLDQISTYISSPALLLCGTSPTSSNTPPVVADIAASYNIPHLTPFELEAPLATDSDHDVLTYCWEEYDLGDFGKTFANTVQSGPIIRSYPPTTSRWRVFPHLDYLRQNILSYTGEKLPSVDRSLDFKLTVRDMYNGDGTFNLSNNEVTLNATTSSGPFKVLGPNSNTSYWKIGNTYNVTWDVANTTGGPVSCANVDIFLSLDDGVTYPITLLTNTPNDGSEQITVPANAQTASARVKVKGAGNVFFDISDYGFIINVWPDNVSEVSFAKEISVYPIPTRDVLHVQLGNNMHYDLQLTNQLGQAVWQGDAEQNKDINVEQLPTGVYYISITQTASGERMVKRVLIQ